MIALLACEDGRVLDDGIGVEWTDEEGAPLWEPFEEQPAPDYFVYALDAWRGTDPSDLLYPGGERRGSWYDLFTGFPGAALESCDPDTADCSRQIGGVGVEWRTIRDRWQTNVRVPVFYLEDDTPLALREMDEFTGAAASNEWLDTPREGCSTLLASGYSLGMHCCTKHVVVTNCDSVTTVNTLDAEHSDTIWGARAIDVDLDGAFDLVTVDWSWAYYGMFGFGGTPTLRRVLRWSPDAGWTLSPRGTDVALYADIEIAAEERWEEGIREDDGPWALRYESLSRAVQGGSARYLAGGTPEEVEALVRRAIQDAYREEYVPLGQILPDPEETIADVIDKMDAYAPVRLVYRSEDADDGF